jgi:hypothetical protein
MASAGAIGTGEKFRKMPGVNNDTVSLFTTGNKSGKPSFSSKLSAPSVRILPCGSMRYSVSDAGTLEFALYNSKGQVISRFVRKTDQGCFVIAAWKLSKVPRGSLYFVTMNMGGTALATSKAFVF